MICWNTSRLDTRLNLLVSILSPGPLPWPTSQPPATPHSTPQVCPALLPSQTHLGQTQYNSACKLSMTRYSVYVKLAVHVWRRAAGKKIPNVRWNPKGFFVCCNICRNCKFDFSCSLYKLIIPFMFSQFQRLVRSLRRCVGHTRSLESLITWSRCSWRNRVIHVLNVITSQPHNRYTTLPTPAICARNLSAGTVICWRKKNSNTFKHYLMGRFVVLSKA